MKYPIFVKWNDGKLWICSEVSEGAKYWRWRSIIVRVTIHNSRQSRRSWCNEQRISYEIAEHNRSRMMFDALFGQLIALFAATTAHNSPKTTHHFSANVFFHTPKNAFLKCIGTKDSSVQFKILPPHKLDDTTFGSVHAKKRVVARVGENCAQWADKHEWLKRTWFIQTKVSDQTNTL